MIDLNAKLNSRLDELSHIKVDMEKGFEDVDNRFDALNEELSTKFTGLKKDN